MKFQLQSPHASHEATYLAGFSELQTDSDRSAWVYLGDSAPRDIPQKDFSAYVETLLKRESEPPPGFVCDSVYWAIDEDGEMVGRISLRHELNEFLEKVGGHIGYIVRPSFRRQGVATEMCRQLLQVPKAQEIGELLVTCDEDNIASEKSILKNGGVYQDTINVGDHRPLKKRFWIQV